MDTWELACLRRVAYRLLGEALLYPEEATVADIAKAAEHLHHDEDASAAMAFHVSWWEFLGCAMGLTPQVLPDLQNGYLSLFGIGAFPEPISLSESAYLDPSGQASGQLMADLETEYSLVGLKASGSNGATPDQVGVELEFASILCGQEEDAAKKGDPRVALEAIHRQQDFLEKHLSLWLPSLSRVVDARDGLKFYAVTLRAARALVVHDVDYLHVWAEHLTFLNSQTVSTGSSTSLP